MSTLMNKRRLNSNSMQTLIAILPEHLIIDNILPRLPAKSLIRFKIVCKLWLSIISSIEFAKSHLKISSLSPKFAVFIENDIVDTHKLFLLPADNNDNVSELVRLELDSNFAFIYLRIVGCCNGLICLYLQDDKMDDYFGIWNPVTRECRKIMSPTPVTASDYGFSYASSIDDYKIIVSFLGDDDCYDVYYFSLRSEEWKSITGLDNAIWHSNTLFCPDKDLDSWKKDKCISGFDLVNEKWIEIPGLDWLSRYAKVDFFARGDGLSLFCHGNHTDQASDVWVLKECGDQNSWEKIFSVNLGGMDFCNMTETYTCLVKRERPNELMMVDLLEDAPDECGVVVGFSGDFCGSGVYFESLISPFSPNQ